MSDYPMLISNKLHSFRNFMVQKYEKLFDNHILFVSLPCLSSDSLVYFCNTKNTINNNLT